jgi:hypothetical protein
MLDGCFHVHGNATVAARGYRDGKLDQLMRPGIEVPGPGRDLSSV